MLWLFKARRKLKKHATTVGRPTTEKLLYYPLKTEKISDIKPTFASQVI